ncbi:2-succinyl-5-enolpyruvyl-6-hydroxy-3-cyclohexene-1-carboxylic-acid synthase [Bacillus sp. HMF5848]|uniref:2-succinyl-5-enolpyruvyl-6-hydroxy-3- cyclohexene-1-carboxylic-acid synthase n=1 Tax=Bacillus sp. HMF5848 TaxID=2495421 RepID=UPI000F7B0899|nr:2-succinyl-5-enolpyruvyl-6-hydroxy-3-cyclohexene-1-carboxylic-acid synthase [Bacillus sp. HMF5848]RSK28280.1 2-succinyl-5-enolpyruvyl-6-hydroxy-3-cyclohexene-1-carboxylic-acid synthase [Bacillus sp. HMF5848]
MSSTNALTKYVAAFIQQLSTLNITDVVVSPGSRSTPIAMLMAEHPSMNVTIHIDERSAAFFALGLAKRVKRPVVLVCTSGTAAANYYPAIVEARYSNIPILVVTADRPHELRDVGAPQAIDQIKMYGDYPKWFVEMGIPEDTEDVLRYVRMVAARAVHTAGSRPMGPVHINMPLREPLVPDLNNENLWSDIEQQQLAKVTPPARFIDDLYLNEYANLFSSHERGLIVVGDLQNYSEQREILNLAEKLQYPVLADPLSQLRSYKHPLLIDGYDAFLKNDVTSELLKPDIVIRFGAMPVSKAFMLFLKKQQDCKQLIVDGSGEWRDPNSQAWDVIHCDEAYFSSRIPSYLEKKQKTKWVQTWLQINTITQSIMQQSIDSEILFEGRIIQELQRNLPNNSHLFVGNSMPIRDLDSFFCASDKTIHIYANRGANGIDGVVSSALGVASVSKPTVLVIGDLSFYHDLNGLLAARMHNIPLTIVLVNNNGGGIFSFLPQAAETKHFEHLFGTPTDLQFEHAVKMYGGVYTLATNWHEFQVQLVNSFDRATLTVIELKTNRYENVEIHRTLWNNVSQEINFLAEGDEQIEG